MLTLKSAAAGHDMRSAAGVLSLRRASPKVKRFQDPLEAFFPHLAAAALLAISDRCDFVKLAARFFPPFRPPLRANSTRSSWLMLFMRSLPSNTAAAFFFAILPGV